VTAVEVVHVVVPAHDEEALLPACLDSLARAADVLRSHRDAPTVRISVVLDACSDRSEAVAVEHAVGMVSTDARCVGAARAAGVESARAQAVEVPPARVWVATTDADSVVPERWLVEQVELRRSDVDVFVGRVHPDDAGIDDRLLSTWWALHTAPHEPPIHGANLGFSLEAYDLAGGFPALRSGEDVALVRAAVEAGCRWTDEGPWVSTSSRLAGRAPGGFASYLSALAEDLEAAG
jgi:glycosyltransferase involved in cell wall biosynthesis